MSQLDQFGRVTLFVTGKEITIQDIDDILKKAHNQLRATVGLNDDTNIFWLVPALDSPSIRVPKNAGGGTSAPANPSFHSPWVGKALSEITFALRNDLPRLGAFIRPGVFVCADSRTGSDGSLLWCRVSRGGPGAEVGVDQVRVSPRAAALHLARKTAWEEVKASWESTRARDGDVLDNVIGLK